MILLIMNRDSERYRQKMKSSFYSFSTAVVSEANFKFMVQIFPLSYRKGEKTSVGNQDPILSKLLYQDIFYLS